MAFSLKLDIIIVGNTTSIIAFKSNLKNVYSQINQHIEYYTYQGFLSLDNDIKNYVIIIDEF